jgi:curved DNA-binding protein CbpA
METDLYGVLGIKKTATQAEIRKAYFQLAKKHHPDKGGDPNVFRKIMEAYQTLSDEKLRDAYDQNKTFPPVNDDKYQTQVEMFRYANNFELFNYLRNSVTFCEYLVSKSRSFYLILTTPFSVWLSV